MDEVYQFFTVVERLMNMACSLGSASAEICIVYVLFFSIVSDA